MEASLTSFHFHSTDLIDKFESRNSFFDFLTTLRKELFENIVGKGENAGN